MSNEVAHTTINENHNEFADEIQIRSILLIRCHFPRSLHEQGTPR